MSKRSYTCPNKCSILPKELEEKIGQEFWQVAEHNNLKFCSICGSMYPETLKKLKSFFAIYQMPTELDKSIDLFLKSEFESSVREAIICLENLLRKKSKLYNHHGFSLASEALKLEVDKKTNQITVEPLIKINNLSNESEFNEHDGLRFMLMGFFKGVRNLYMHKHIGASMDMPLSILVQISFFIKILNGASLNKKARWIKVDRDGVEIDKD